MQPLFAFIRNQCIPNDSSKKPFMLTLKENGNSVEDGQTFGTYLIIDNLRREDYGEYICKITKPGKSIEQRVYVAEKSEVKYLNPNPVPVTKLILCMSAIFFLCLAAVILNLQYGLPLRVRFKDSFGIVEENDGKANDVLILYSSKDSEIALGVLMPTLQTKFNYKCVSREFPLNLNYWFGELQDEALKSRRIIALLSPPVLNDTWTTAGIYQAIKQLQALGPKLICVTLKELPKCENETKNSQGETLSSLTRTINVIVWERAKDDKFWLALRLRLPPKRRNDRLVECRNQSQGKHNARCFDFVAAYSSIVLFVYYTAVDKDLAERMLRQVRQDPPSPYPAMRI
ncbi:hypothetical protein Zmor_014294 [Zophobas morio]|uniref:TIR domain-containing protein n=1 Tax=Zophobas morio TaxID=2755281 RepID=A0AA38IH58_9CUCU|nr:hypothetical protein Zmor_014294 [Zophobas morio]